MLFHSIRLLRISIHAPRTGSDQPPYVVLTGEQEFQSTPPARGATNKAELVDAIRAISIHAPRTGSDTGKMLSAQGVGISIHAPRTGSDKVSIGY